jgi:hypothetical protein
MKGWQTMSEVTQPEGKSWIDERGTRFKVEKNTKGYNWSIAVVPLEGESDEATHARLVAEDQRMERDFGRR